MNYFIYFTSNLPSLDIVLCHTAVLVRTTTRCFKFALTLMLFPFRCFKLDKFKVEKCLSRRIRAIWRPRAWQKCRNEDCLLWKFSRQQLKCFINIGTKTGDVGKFFFFRWHLAKATTSILEWLLLQEWHFWPNSAIAKGTSHVFNNSWVMFYLLQGRVQKFMYFSKFFQWNNSWNLVMDLNSGVSGL